MPGPMTRSAIPDASRSGRRIWLAAFGGVVATHVVGCAVSSAGDPKSPGRPGDPDGDEPGGAPSGAKSPDPDPSKPRLPTELALPPRPPSAEKASAFLKRVEGLGRGALDDAVFEAFAAGNVP